MQLLPLLLLFKNLLDCCFCLNDSLNVTKQGLGQTEFHLERWPAQPFDTDSIWQWVFWIAVRVSRSLLRMSFSITANFHSLRGFSSWMRTTFFSLMIVGVFFLLLDDIPKEQANTRRETLSWIDWEGFDDEWRSFFSSSGRSPYVESGFSSYW